MVDVARIHFYMFLPGFVFRPINIAALIRLYQRSSTLRFVGAVGQLNKCHVPCVVYSLTKILLMSNGNCSGTQMIILRSSWMF